MDLGRIANLPFDRWYLFQASLGVITIVGSLFLKTVFLTNQTVFEMGGIAFIFGILGWLLEKFWSDYQASVNNAWQHLIHSLPVGESPYDYWDINPIIVSITQSISKILLFLVFLFAEAWVYPHWP